MQFKIAELSDIDATLKLHAKYQIDNIKEEDKADGFVTTAFTKEELTELISEEQGLFIAKNEKVVLGYVMAASWHFWSKWEMFRFMIADLENLEYLGQQLNTENSYQYGPVCIDKAVRGSGLLESLFNLAREHMSRRYSILVTFVNKSNPRSYQAHKRKLGLTVIQEFQYNNNEYYEFVYDASKALNLSSEEKVFYTKKPFIQTINHPIEYLAYQDFFNKKTMQIIYADKEKHYYWTDDFSAEYYIAQAKAGFIAVTMEYENQIILAPEIQKSYAVLHFKDLHISRKVKKLIKQKNLKLDIGNALTDVYHKINDYHIFTWLKKPYLETLKAVEHFQDRNMKIVTIILTDEKKAIAGEIGYMIGKTYTSLAAFSSNEKKYNNYGTAQLVLLAQYLEAEGFTFLNLGQPFMPYKIDLGAKIYEREDFLKIWNDSI
ncbi:MAG: Leucyl/phenylalanyl-tRNA--protein transferase (EC [uncultured Sulfurovum sp.]|uniref:Leucyl/phenylalanyl-tRNA--protein transferase (EC) n=1 Tax=uncultured Sulfurovum sp. TaxID=269237 RepID=A0A6S6TPN8_9BACT|nr:MAG: Leucyl/phenylalanyl-tRNA--protein transferase (EC [uncultured Sulfurovum sp.]